MRDQLTPVARQLGATSAGALGLERSHLYRKMKTLGIHLGE